MSDTAGHDSSADCADPEPPPTVTDEVPDDRPRLRRSPNGPRSRRTDDETTPPSTSPTANPSWSRCHWTRSPTSRARPTLRRSTSRCVARRSSRRGTRCAAATHCRPWKSPNRPTKRTTTGATRHRAEAAAETGRRHRHLGARAPSPPARTRSGSTRCRRWQRPTPTRAPSKCTWTTSGSSTHRMRSTSSTRRATEPSSPATRPKWSTPRRKPRSHTSSIRASPAHRRVAPGSWAHEPDPERHQHRLLHRLGRLRGQRRRRDRRRGIGLGPARGVAEAETAAATIAAPWTLDAESQVVETEADNGTHPVYQAPVRLRRRRGRERARGRRRAECSCRTNTSRTSPSRPRPSTRPSPRPSPSRSTCSCRSNTSPTNPSPPKPSTPPEPDTEPEPLEAWVPYQHEPYEPEPAEAVAPDPSPSSEPLEAFVPFQHEPYEPEPTDSLTRRRPEPDLEPAPTRSVRAVPTRAVRTRAHRSLHITRARIRARVARGVGAVPTRAVRTRTRRSRLPRAEPFESFEPAAPAEPFEIEPSESDFVIEGDDEPPRDQLAPSARQRARRTDRTAGTGRRAGPGRADPQRADVRRAHTRARARARAGTRATEPEPRESFVVAGAEWVLGNAVPLVEVRSTGSLVMRRADERWALADVIASTDFAVEVNVDLRSGPGFGVLFCADLDDEGRMSGYSFDVDPVYEGGGYLVREWRADRELWNPIAHVAAPDLAGMNGILERAPHRRRRPPRRLGERRSRAHDRQPAASVDRPWPRRRVRQPGGCPGLVVHRPRHRRTAPRQPLTLRRSARTRRCPERREPVRSLASNLARSAHLVAAAERAAVPSPAWRWRSTRASPRPRTTIGGTATPARSSVTCSRPG